MAYAVEQHPIVLQLELAETDFLPGHLYQMACIVQQLDLQVIQSRVLCTPQVGVLHRMAEQRRAAVQCDFFGEHFQFTAAQGQTGCALTLANFGLTCVDDTHIYIGEHKRLPTNNILSACVFLFVKNAPAVHQV